APRHPPRAAAGRRGAARPPAPAADEKRLAPTRLGPGHDEARLQPAQALEAAHAVDDVLERLDPVAQPRRLLVAELVGEPREPSAQTRQGTAVEQALELQLRACRECPRGERSPAPARDRPELGRRLRHHKVLAAALQVDAMLLPAAA